MSLIDIINIHYKKIKENNDWIKIWSKDILYNTK